MKSFKMVSALIVVGSALTMTLTACGSKTSETSSSGTQFTPGKPADGTAEKVTDVTPRGQCAYGAPARSLEGRWQFDLQQGEINFHMIFDFRNGYMNLTNNCEIRGHRLAVTVGAPYMDQNRQLTVMGEANDSEHSSEGGFDLNCSASIKRGRMTYSFNGSCLEMRAENTSEVLTLLPASYN